MAKHFRIIRNLLVVLVCCIGINIYLNMKIVATQASPDNYVPRLVEVFAAVSSFAIATKSNVSIKANLIADKKKTRFFPNLVVRNSKAISSKNSSTNNTTYSLPEHNKQTKLLHMGPQFDSLQEHTAGERKNSSIKVIHKLQLHDDPQSFINSQKEANKQFEEKRQKSVEYEQRIQQQLNIMTAIFNMVNQLNQLSKKKGNNKQNIVFDLSQKAKNANNIGPFTEAAKINNSHKSVLKRNNNVSNKTRQESGHHLERMLLRHILNSKYTKSKDNVNKNATEKKPQPATQSLIQRGKSIANSSVKPIQAKNVTVAKRKLKTVPMQRNGPTHEIDSNEISLSEEQIRDIREDVRKRNIQQQIINKSLFGPVQKNTTIILIQIHNRIENLRFLIKSLIEAKYIEKCLVVFSHDFWSSEINEFISNITAFRAMQIFYPFSVQLHPRAFPGLDPRDCLWNYVPRSRRTRARARKMRACLNEPWPDSYGHYREPMMTQLKHHWWWKVHWVFDHLNVTRNWTGDALLLEDDNYVAPDVLHTLWLLRDLAPSRSTSMLSLGNFNIYAPAKDTNKVVVGDWGGSKYNIGFAFNAITWSAIKKNSEFFCTRDDYNWDWTLSMLLQQDQTLRGNMLAAKLTRVHHISSCQGTHRRQRSCDVSALVNLVKHKIVLAKRFLYPKNLTILAMTKSAVRQKKCNGGWGDFRDIQLCLAIANGTASEETIDILQHSKYEL